jgi:hypothetical protein
MSLSAPRIVSAAMQRSDGLIVASPRHWDSTCHRIVEKLEVTPLTQAMKWTQGFIDQHGIFHTRKEAWDLANLNGQIIRQEPHTVGTLYSENLY